MAMSASDRQSDHFGTLLRVNQEAFESGNYEVAYHALMAALHCGQDVGNERQLLEVERIAQMQQSGIDCDAPQHRLSSQAARSRGHLGVFGLAARQASASALMSKARARSETVSAEKDGPATKLVT